MQNIASEPISASTNDAMAPHTFTYICFCNKRSFYQLFDTLITQNGIVPQKTVTGICTKYTTHKYYSKGFGRIEFQAYESTAKHPYTYNVKFLCNPKILIGDADYLCNHIIEKSKVKEIPITLKEVLESICNTSNNLSIDGIYQRIDYCCNFWFTSEKCLKEYMQLLKKGKPPSRLSIKNIHVPEQKQVTTEKNEITFSCGSYELSIYLKQPQLINRLEKNESVPIYDLIDAKNQLRIELREFRPKLRQNKKKLGNNEEALINGSNFLPLQTLVQALKSAYGTGDFYRYKEAIQMIQNSLYRSKVKKTLLDILKSVKRARSLDPEKNGLDPYVLKRYIIYFNELELSPITLPKRSKEIYYPNPIKYINGETHDLLLYSDVWQE